ncbi:MAG: hypothetical protein U9R60_05925 [Bacteroidota bacterium]|nr:hypothetical protein [Bacteroidota bacterium]
MFNHKTGRRAILVFSFLLLTVLGFSQVRISSPYSRYGVGLLRRGDYNIVLSSMGGISNAIQSPYYINFANPASYSGFDSTSFIFDAGVDTELTTLKSNDVSQQSMYGSLAHVLFGFPITRWCKVSMGVLPFSDVGYNIVQENHSENIGRTLTQYEGTGGINQAYLGAGFSVTKHLSLGFNLIYYFGTMNRFRKVYFPDSLSTYVNSNLENKIKVSDLSVNFGAQYKVPLKNDLSLIAGLTFALENKMRAHREYIANTFQGGLGADEFFLDTVAYIPEEKGTILIPAFIGAGLVLEKQNHWLIGADFDFQNWEKFRIFDYPDSLENSFEIRVGGQYIPNKKSLNSYWRRMTFRAGARYTQLPLVFRNQQINEFGISFGFSLPLRRSKSTFNFGFEFGRRGTTAEDLVQENFIKFNFGITLYERWFVRRRYK